MSTAVKATTKTAPKTKPYTMQLAYAEPKQFVSLATMKAAALKKVDELSDWCKIYNRVGIGVVEDLKATIGSLTDLDLPTSVNTVIDDYSGVRFQCAFSKEVE